ncbi:MAG: DUF1349 domain-containing protein [Chloroflexota bacterium]
MTTIDWDQLTWRNPPPEARREGDALVVTTGGGTDWWRITGYGFDNTNGHLLGAPFANESALEVTFRADLTAQYDQAGLMLHAADDTWIKAGLERADGVLWAAVVVTHGFSDWSVVPLEAPSADTPVTIRVSRSRDAVTFRYGIGDEAPERLLRIAHWAPDLVTTAGPMTCSPTRAGLVVRFDPVRVGPPDAPLTA